MDGIMTNSDSGRANADDTFGRRLSVLITLIGIGISVIQSHQQETAATQGRKWRQEDLKTGELAERRMDQRHINVVTELEGISRGVRKIATSIEPPQLVLASVVKNHRVSATTLRPTQNCPFSRPDGGDSRIELIAAANRPLIDIVAVWLINGEVADVAVQNAVLSGGERLAVRRFPKFLAETTTKGTLRIEFSDSLGFRGAVEHPFVIATCSDHIHLTIESHTFQSWMGPPESRSEN